MLGVVIQFGLQFSVTTLGSEPDCIKLFMKNVDCEKQYFSIRMSIKVSVGHSRENGEPDGTAVSIRGDFLLLGHRCQKCLIRHVVASCSMDHDPFYDIN